MRLEGTINSDELEDKSFTGIVEYDDGDIVYYVNGLRHRDDGPAIIGKSGTGFERQIWCKNGKYHREMGPAVIYPGNQHWWYLDGVSYSNFCEGSLNGDLAYWKAMWNRCQDKNSKQATNIMANILGAKE